MIARSLMIGVAAAALMVTGAQAADLYVPETPVEIYEDEGFSFEGAYVGVQGGGVFSGFGSAGLIGVVAGVNFVVADPILLGAEVEADAFFWSGAFRAADVLVSAKIGALVTDDVMIYGKAGVGYLGGSGIDRGVYQIGAGIEFGVAENVSLRGEALYYDDFNGVGTDGFGKFTAGVLFHF